MKYSIFGKRLVEVVRQDGGWVVFYLGNEGKKRIAQDIVIPSSVSEADIEDYLADVFHEYATLKNNTIERLDP